jgi:hypothetical protein
MKSRAKVEALLEESRRSLKTLRRIRKKLRALREHIGSKKSKKKKAGRQ